MREERATSHARRVVANGEPITGLTRIPLAQAFTFGAVTAMVEDVPATELRPASRDPGPEAPDLPDPDASGAAYLPSPFSDDGRFVLATAVRRFDSAAPGSYTLVVEGGATRPVAVSEGGTAVVELP